MNMNNWCLTFLLTLATSTLLVKVASAEKESGSCPAASASSPAADELRAKIDELETKLKETQRETGKLRLKVYELKKESVKQSEELNSTAKERTEVAEEKRKCMDELNRAIGRLGSIDRDNRLGRKQAILCAGQKEQIEADLKKVTAELEEAMAGGSCAAKEGVGGGGVDGSESLREELTNCEETVKAVRDRCDRDSKDLRRIEKTHERIRKGLEDCTEKAKVCEGEKDHLAFLKRGYDIIVKQMEEETQDAKDKKEKSEASAKEAIKGVSKYKFYLAGIAVLALIGGTIKLYSYVQTKLAERLANLAAAKQKDKAEAKRRSPTSLAKQKKKLS